MFDFHHLKLKSQDISSSEEIDTIKINSIDHNLKIRSLETSLSKYKLSPIGENEWNPTVQLRCGICWGNIEDDDKNVSKCPHCSRKFHKAHWIDWINKKSYCPTCRKSLRSLQ
ncbi:MAG: RING finger protein [Candidatus Hodarchaeales archaeon]|jgi:uncharacterized CHY-type Zn-finger protein